MKPMLVLTTVLTSALIAAPLYAAPPVKVKVLVDEEADDFFDDAPPPPKKEDSVKSRAEAAFEALEREEERHGKVRVTTSDKNNQIVNVVVVGGEQKSEATVPPPAPPAPPVAPVAPVMSVPPPPPVAPATPPPPPAPPAATVEEDWDCFSWFGDKNVPKQADLMLFGALAGTDSGGFGMIGAEIYMTDVIGLRLQGGIGTYGISGGEGRRGRRGRGGDQEIQFDRVNGSVWANPNRTGEVQDAIAHLMEASLTIHLNPQSSFDPYISGGASHFGYDVLYDDDDVQGGAGYVRFGAGFNWHLGSFFAGLDLGWYPIEFARYERVGEEDIDFVEVEDTFVAQRLTGSAHVGFRF